jgi:hypothetical protein
MQDYSRDASVTIGRNTQKDLGKTPIDPKKTPIIEVESTIDPAEAY